jgi:hypothetical protein
MSKRPPPQTLPGALIVPPAAALVFSLLFVSGCCEASQKDSRTTPVKPSGPHDGRGGQVDRSAEGSPKASEESGETGKRATWSEDETPPSEAGSKTAGDGDAHEAAVTFRLIGRGMIRLPQKKGQPPTAGTGTQRTAYAIRTAKGLKSLIARVPKRIITKGQGPPNPDPILKNPTVDLSKEMVVVVQYDYMWKPPKVKKVVATGDQIRVKAEFMKIRGIVQHAYGVGSYVAFTVPKSKRTVVLSP